MRTLQTLSSETHGCSRNSCLRRSRDAQRLRVPLRFRPRAPRAPQPIRRRGREKSPGLSTRRYRQAKALRWRAARAHKRGEFDSATTRVKRIIRKSAPNPSRNLRSRLRIRKSDSVSDPAARLFRARAHAQTKPMRQSISTLQTPKFARKVRESGQASVEGRSACMPHLVARQQQSVVFVLTLRDEL